MLHSVKDTEPGRLICVLKSEQEVRDFSPDLAELMRCGNISVCVTAPGHDVDFVSRYFAPNHGVDEDPVTGSNHSLLTPYWSERLGQKSLTARQVSPRGGQLWCRNQGDRVEIAGYVAEYLEGTITVPS